MFVCSEREVACCRQEGRVLFLPVQEMIPDESVPDDAHRRTSIAEAYWPVIHWESYPTSRPEAVIWASRFFFFFSSVLPSVSVGPVTSAAFPYNDMFTVHR